MKGAIKGIPLMITLLFKYLAYARNDGVDLEFRI
jgi:hypothetical protein